MWVIQRIADAGISARDNSEFTPAWSGWRAMFLSIVDPGSVFLVLALIAALFGFGVVSAESLFVAKVFIFSFLVLAVTPLMGGLRPDAE
jgi:uncharacterized membrane protein YtjA (UPF0391 family)